jgi:uncharacterized protein (DUF885 family)
MKWATRRQFLGRATAMAGGGALLQLLPGVVRNALAQSTGDASARLQSILGRLGRSNDFEKARESDLSAESFARELASTRALLQELTAIDRAQLGKEESIDLRFAESILRGRLLAQESMQRWKKDPRIYLQLRSLSLWATQPDPTPARADQVIAFLNALPARLANGEKNLEVWIPRFGELSRFMVDNSLSIFRDDVPAFADKLPGQKARILKANAAALAAVEHFQKFVHDVLPAKPKADFAIGRATYDTMLKQQYLLDYNADTLYDFAWKEFKSTVWECEALAAKIEPGKPWLEVAAKIKEDGPNPLEMIQAHQLWVDRAKAHVLAKKLIPIPWKERVDVVPRAEYLRKTSYYGNFSEARGPDKDGVLVGQWQINTFLPSWSDAEKKSYMVEHDWGVIIDTAPHETYAGHHVHGLYLLANPNQFRKTSSVSIFSEGWGLYNEQLMQETGFFPNEGIHLRQLQLRLWRIARVIWDVGTNTGKFSYEDSVNLLVNQVGFQRWAAELEVDYSAENPGYQLGYYMGCSEIVRMREEFKRVRGAAFTLSDFHERLLKQGSMPPALMREGLMNSIARA